MIKLAVKLTTIKLVVLLALFTVGGYALGVNQDVIRSALKTPISFLPPVVSLRGTVRAKDLAVMLKSKNFTLINVHTPYEGEIEKTDTFVAFDSLVNSTSLLPFDKTTPIIVYCKTGRMSAEALTTIQKMGYTNVKHLDGGMEAWQRQGGKIMDLSKLDGQIIPEQGTEMPVSWGSIGPKLVSLGVIGDAKFRQAMKMTTDQEEIYSKGTDKKIKIDRTNVQFVVDMLWALGLAQKSLVYDEGPMGTQYRKDAGNFASTGGWTLSSGSPMQYYNKYDLIPLTSAQQKQVAEISKNVYRPCCGNSTYFPDCNHGMAALAMIELMVSANIDENTIYKTILAFNSYWFPDTYLTTATYFARQGVAWQDVDAKTVMGQAFSSGQGAADIAKKVGPLPGRPKSGTSCGA